MINHQEKSSQMLNDILNLYSNRQIQSLQYHTFSWDQASEGYRFMAKALHIGKVLITSPIWDNVKSTKPEPEVNLQSSVLGWNSIIKKFAQIPDATAIREIKKIKAV